jgi:hypothetical protein
VNRLLAAVLAQLPSHRRTDTRLDCIGSAVPKATDELEKRLIAARAATEHDPIPTLFDLDALRLVDVPDLNKGLMARANALQWNRDLINTAIAREIEAPARRTIREHNGIVTEWAFIAPSACRWCDLEQRDHGRRFAWLVGDHEYTAPTTRMRLSRMQGRRAARTRAGAL